MHACAAGSTNGSVAKALLERRWSTPEAQCSGVDGDVARQPWAVATTTISEPTVSAMAATSVPRLN